MKRIHEMTDEELWLDSMRGAAAISEEEYAAMQVKQGHLMANAQVSPEQHARMRNAYRPMAKDAPEPTPLPPSIKRSWWKRLFGR